MEYQKITKVLKNSETVKIENGKQIPKEVLKERYYLQKKDRKLLII